MDEIAAIVLSESAPSLKTYRLQVLMASSDVALPYNAAFPNDEGQIHFFASPFWHDRMAFDPERALAGLRSPVLVMIGTEDPNTPMEAYLAAVQPAAATTDATVCRIEGRIRHSFTDEAVEAIGGWLAERVDVNARGGLAPAPPTVHGATFTLP